jgi:hypothetical protein
MVFLMVVYIVLIVNIVHGEFVFFQRNGKLPKHHDFMVEIQ